MNKRQKKARIAKLNHKTIKPKGAVIHAPTAKAKGNKDGR